MKKTKLKPKIHEFRSAILFIKKTEEHKPKKKSYKPRKSNIRTQENQTQKNHKWILYKQNQSIYVYIHKPNYPKQNQSTYTNTNLAQPYQHKAKLKLK